MTTVGDIFRVIDAFAPFETQMSFDNAGLLVGSASEPVEKALLALDITEAVVEEAAQMHAQLIISHHPIIFQPLRSLKTDSVPYRLAQCGISAICAHTNLDLAQGGVNTCLAQKLRMSDCTQLWVEDQPEGVIGMLSEEMPPKEFARFVKTELHSKGLTYTDGGKAIRKIAVCGGSGAEILFAAKQAGADAVVTGESKHHLLLAAREMCITLVTAGHYETECVVLKPLCARLRQALPSVCFALSQAEQNPVFAPEDE